MVSVPLTEGTNWNFARGYPTEITIFIYLVKVVSVPLFERKKQIFDRGPPTEFFFKINFFSQWYRVTTIQDGVRIEFHFTYIFVRMFLLKPISMIRIVEYSTVSVLEYFGDTLANVGLPEA